MIGDKDPNSPEKLAAVRAAQLKDNSLVTRGGIELRSPYGPEVGRANWPLNISTMVANPASAPADTIEFLDIPRQGDKYIHPWKVTANGDSTVRVAAGKVLSYADQSLSIVETAIYGGADSITVGGAGVIYGETGVATDPTPIVNSILTDSGGDTLTLELYRQRPDGGVVTVGWASAITTDTSFFRWEIARVTLEDGVAVVVADILTSNPVIWSLTGF